MLQQAPGLDPGEERRAERFLPAVDFILRIHRRPREEQRLHLLQVASSRRFPEPLLQVAAHPHPPPHGSAFLTAPPAPGARAVVVAATAAPAAVCGTLFSVTQEAEASGSDVQGSSQAGIQETRFLPPEGASTPHIPLQDADGVGRGREARYRTRSDSGCSTPFPWRQRNPNVRQRNATDGQSVEGQPSSLFNSTL